MNQITITLHQIKKHNPCIDGWRKVVKANGGPNADMDKPFPVSSILESNGLDNTFWVLQCLPEYGHLWRKFAWWCASNVSHLVNDNRVDNCLKTVWEYTEGNATREDLEAAASAAWPVAWTASEAAAWAIAAAWAAAWTAADADAAAAAARAADGAAAGATDAASNAVKGAQEQKLKEILDCGEFKQKKETTA